MTVILHRVICSAVSTLSRSSRLPGALGLAIALSLGACGEPSSDEPEEVVCGGFGELVDGACVCEAGYWQNPRDAVDCVVDDVEHGDGLSQVLVLNLHEGQVKLRLDLMTVMGEQFGVYDLRVTSITKACQVPHRRLLQHVHHRNSRWSLARVDGRQIDERVSRLRWQTRAKLCPVGENKALFAVVKGC